MAGTVKIDTRDFLGSHEDNDDLHMLRCNAHDTSVWHWSDTNCGACEEKATVNSEIPELKEKLEVQGKFLKLAELERDQAQRELEDLKREAGEFLVQKRAVAEAVKKVL